MELKQATDEYVAAVDAYIAKAKGSTAITGGDRT